jgi:hypothetical protein
MNLPVVRAKCLGSELADLPSAWRGRALHVQCGFFLDPSTPETDFNNVTQFHLILTRDRMESMILASTTIVGAEAVNPMTLAGWNNGTQEHLTFLLPGPMMSFPILDPDERIWFAVRATLLTGEAITKGSGYILVRNDAASSDLTGPILTPEADPLTIAFANGVATLTHEGVNYQFSAEGPDVAKAGVVYPVVSGGVMVVVIEGAPFAWSVAGDADAPAGPVVLTVTGNLMTAGMQSLSFSWPVSQV